LSPAIPVDVALQLLLPEFRVALWLEGVFAARVLMPETAMDEDHGPILWKHYVWLAREVLDVEAVSESLGM
jgi:hypothetical protein